MQGCKARGREEHAAEGLCDLIQRRLAEASSLPLELYLGDVREVSSCFGDVLVTACAGTSAVNRHASGRVDEWGWQLFR